VDRSCTPSHPQKLDMAGKSCQNKHSGLSIRKEVNKAYDIPTRKQNNPWGEGIVRRNGSDHDVGDQDRGVHEGEAVGQRDYRAGYRKAPGRVSASGRSTRRNGEVPAGAHRQLPPQGLLQDQPAIQLGVNVIKNCFSSSLTKRLGCSFWQALPVEWHLRERHLRDVS